MSNTTRFFKERMSTITRGLIYVILIALAAFREDLRDLAQKGVIDVFSWIDVGVGFVITTALALAAYLDKTHQDLVSELKAKRAAGSAVSRTEMEWVKSQLPPQPKP